jgi:protein-disulfide isomerase
VNRTLVERWAGTVARLILAAVFGYAALSKLGEPRTFLRAVRAYQATPEWLSQAIAYGLPVLELCLAVVLLFGVATRVAAFVSAVLFVVFLVGIVQAWGRGLKLECGCFGGGGVTTHSNYWIDVVRDVLLLAVAAVLIWRPLSNYSVDDYLTNRHEVAPPSAKAVRRDPKAIARYQAKRAARERENRGRLRYVAGATAGVVVLICLIGVSVQSSRARITGTLTATNATVANGVVVGKAAAPVTLDTYEDFQCPNCEIYEAGAAADLAKLVSAGKIKVRYHTMAFLDSSSSGNKYSTRAANAALCASDVSTTAFAAYHAVLFGKDSTGAKVQPEEGSDGRTDGQLEAYFKQAVPKATSTQTSTFATCVTDQEHSAMVAAITDAASKKDVNGTPTVFVDGKKVTATRADVLAAITKASAG